MYIYIYTITTWVGTPFGYRFYYDTEYLSRGTKMGTSFWELAI